MTSNDNRRPVADRSQIKATTRILMALSAFAADVDSFGVTELAQQLGMTKNMVYRALTTLTEQGYVVRNSKTQRYQLGYRVMELRNHHTLEPDLRALCAPIMQRLQEATGETVSLVVRARDYAVMIDGLETRLPGTYRMVLGALHSLHAPSTGLIILAYSDDEEIEDYIGRNSPMTSRQGEQVISAKELRRRIQQTREKGYAEVVHPGALPMLSVAFPIWASGGKLHGAMGTGGPLERFGPRLPQLLPAIRDMLGDLQQHTRLYPADPQQWAIS